MAGAIIFKSAPNGPSWRVTQDDRLVRQYSIQFIAERAATRLATMAAKRGNLARTIFVRHDGSLAADSAYDVVG